MPANTKPAEDRPRSMKDRTSDYSVQTDIIEIASRQSWFALQVSPQKEIVAQKILRRRGFKTFVPVKVEWRHSSPKAKRTRQPKEPFSYPVAPRYVFVGIDRRRSDAWNVLRLPCVQGVVGGLDGRPLQLVTKEMVRLIRRTATGINAPEAQKFMRTHHEFAVGDIVRVMDGPFEGLSVPVVEITGGLARLGLSLFGGAVDGVEVRLDWLEAA